VKTSYLKTDTCKAQSLQRHDSRAQSADFPKACSEPRRFICLCIPVQIKGLTT